MNAPSDRTRPNGFHFDNLSTIDRLEILAHDPCFRAVADALPQYGESKTGRPASSSTAGMLVVGAATVLCGNDRRAAADLRRDDQLRRIFRDAGIPYPERGLAPQSFRDFRDKFAARTGGLMSWNQQIREINRQFAVQRTAEMGLLSGCDWSAEQGWETVPPERIICGDATCFGQRTPSDAIQQNPTVIRVGSTDVHRYGSTTDGTDIDRLGKTWGYSHVIAAVSGSKPRQWQALDIVRARTSDGDGIGRDARGDEIKSYEMTAMLDAARHINALLPDDDVVLAYDGAARGVHHREIRESLGWFTTNVARGSTRTSHHELPGTPLNTNAGGVEFVFESSDGSECRHELNLANGTLWRTHNDVDGGRRYLAHAGHNELVRHRDGDRYRWELTIEVWCQQHGESHHRTIDPNATVSGKSLAEALRPISQTEDAFWRIFGRRNMIESMNNYLKNYLFRGERAMSRTSHAHELDLRIAGLILNAIAWAEHGNSGYRNLS